VTTLPENAEAALSAAFETALAPKLPQYIVDEIGVREKTRSFISRFL
jgi:hypothetical protein